MRYCSFRILRLLVAVLLVVLQGCAISPRPEAGFLVRVVDGASDERAAYASVVFCDWTHTPVLREAWRVQAEAESLSDIIEAHGIHLVCDGQGELRVPWLGHAEGILMVRQGGMIEYQDLPVSRFAGPEPIVIRLRPDPPVQVKVVDQGGRPVCGAPVSLRLLPMFGYHTLRRVATNEAGLAVIGGIRRATTVSNSLGQVAKSDSDRWSGNGMVTIALDLPGPQDARRQNFLVWNLPQAVTLVMPDTGSLELDLSAWKPSEAEPCHVAVIAAVDQTRDKDSAEEPDYPLATGSRIVKVTADLARIDMLPLGISLRVIVWREEEAPYCPVPLASLTKVGEGPHLIVPKVADKPRQELNIVTSAGPLIDTWTVLDVGGYDGHRKTDKEGRVQFPEPPPGTRTDINVRVLSEADVLSGSRSAGSERVYMVPAPGVVEGRVVGAGGDALAGVRVSAEGANVHPTITDRDGRFALRCTSWWGPEPMEGATILARVRGLAPCRTKLEVGKKDHLLQFVEESQNFRLRLRVPASMNADHLHLGLSEQSLGCVLSPERRLISKGYYEYLWRDLDLGGKNLKIYYGSRALRLWLHRADIPVDTLLEIGLPS